MVNWLTRCVVISIHALCEEGDALHLLLTPVRWNFYPRPLRGGRHLAGGPRPDGADFYPRPLRGGRRWRAASPFTFLSFLSTPSARRATFYRTHDDNDSKISIHALCEEGDLSCG